MLLAVGGVCGIAVAPARADDAKDFQDAMFDELADPANFVAEIKPGDGNLTLLFANGKEIKVKTNNGKVVSFKSYAKTRPNVEIKKYSCLGEGIRQMKQAKIPIQRVTFEGAGKRLALVFSGADSKNKTRKTKITVGEGLCSTSGLFGESRQRSPSGNGRSPEGSAGSAHDGMGRAEDVITGDGD